MSKNDFGFTNIEFEEESSTLTVEEMRQKVKELYDLIDEFIQPFEKGGMANTIKWPADKRKETLTKFRRKISDIYESSLF